jgi:hypothetical protein
LERYRRSQKAKDEVKQETETEPGDEEELAEQQRIDKILANLFFNDSDAVISEGVTFDANLR